MATKKKKITLEDLALFIKESEKRIIKEIDTKIDTKIDGLAAITKRGFDGVDERFNKVDKRLDSLEQGQEDIIRSNTREHEELKLRQDEVPYRFEFVELEKRVEVLERMR